MKYLFVLPIVNVLNVFWARIEKPICCYYNQQMQNWSCRPPRSSFIIHVPLPLDRMLLIFCTFVVQYKDNNDAGSHLGRSAACCGIDYRHPVFAAVYVASCRANCALCFRKFQWKGQKKKKKENWTPELIHSFHFSLNNSNQKRFVFVGGGGTIKSDVNLTRTLKMLLNQI